MGNKKSPLTTHHLTSIYEDATTRKDLAKCLLFVAMVPYSTWWLGYQEHRNKQVVIKQTKLTLPNPQSSNIITKLFTKSQHYPFIMQFTL